MSSQVGDTPPTLLRHSSDTPRHSKPAIQTGETRGSCLSSVNSVKLRHSDTSDTSETLPQTPLLAAAHSLMTGTVLTPPSAPTSCGPMRPSAHGTSGEDGPQTPPNPPPTRSTLRHSTRRARDGRRPVRDPSATARESRRPVRDPSATPCDGPATGGDPSATHRRHPATGWRHTRQIYDDYQETGRMGGCTSPSRSHAAPRGALAPRALHFI